MIEKIRKNFEILDLKKEEINDFIIMEMALTVIKELNLDIDIDRGYYIFCGYDLIKERNKNIDNFFLQKARIVLRKLKSKKVYREKLEKYCSDKYKNLRLYQIENIEDKEEKRLKEIEISEIYYNERAKDYIEYIKKYKTPKKVVKYVEDGKYWFFNKDSENGKAYLKFEGLDRIINVEEKKTVPTQPREKIKITLTELKEAAKEMKKINSNDYALDVLEKNIIKTVKENNISEATEIVIDKIVNIVGMVGAGKSTLLKVIVYLLNKKNKKIAIITDTVGEVFNLYKYFKKLNCSCSPFIGKSDRNKYVNLIINDNEMYLDEDLSGYLTSYCLLDGEETKIENSLEFGEEPCTKLKEEKDKNERNRICPYFDICSTTRMQRNIEDKNIIITTVPGLIMGKIGVEQKILMEEIFENFDLVFFDECDRVQKELDKIFTPVLSFDEYHLKNYDQLTNYIKKPIFEKMEDPHYTNYFELLLRSHLVLTRMIEIITAVKELKKKTPIEDTYSSYTVLENIKDIASRREGNYFKNVIRAFENFLDKEKKLKFIDDELEDILDLSYEKTKDERFSRKLKIWLHKQEELFNLNENNELEITAKLIEDENKRRERIKKEEKDLEENWELYKLSRLFLILVYLDRFIIELEIAYENVVQNGVEKNELSNFIKKRFFKLQEYLPSSLMGNLFGIKVKENKDILLYKQYAFGRSFMIDLPYLKINENGEPLGPHTVLLSGSSFAKGSLEYHVDVNVNYIIEASKEVRNYIEKTKFKEIKSSYRISGSTSKIKEELLKKLTVETGDYIIKELNEKEGKILIVVNSYAQVKIVAESLEKYFLEKNINEKICRMISNNENEINIEQETISRGEIQNFLNYEERVLIAPAICIERGHNITDEKGHSLLSSIFFFIRPLGVPDDLETKIITLNGFITQEVDKFKNGDIFEKNKKIRLKAIEFWNEMNKKRRLDNIDNEILKINIVATMFVLILQIFGRLCRVTNLEKTPPTVYFVDGAFRRKDDDETGFDALNELYNFLFKRLNDSKEGEIFKTLYEPFFKAYKGGIKYENGSK